ncbi:hypothetical protein M9Y10_018904 [Tritrichomonas musculus]|uniref:DUF3447 domain-containing protein n=1 Tax=Tritrichomonas musculus TaxID=1915356 RepID=A0ABR2HI54_9EUKA
MSFEDHIQEARDIQKAILNFLDDEQNSDINYQYLIKLFEDLKIYDNQYNLKLLLHLLCSISNNHHRSSDFFNKINQILFFLKESITKYFSNLSIFNIFKSNKRMLLLLIESKIMIIDRVIAIKLQSEEYKKEGYHLYFGQEISSALNQRKSIEQKENFLAKRKIGENDEYICTLIQKDLIDEFISHINKTNYPIKATISQSIFETNNFLLRQQSISLIEYAAFFGSIQIIKYLLINNVKLEPSIWLYAIHSDNAELIHLIEENHIDPKDKSYKECIKESIKCHSNDITNYFENNYITNNDEYSSFIHNQSIKYYNFEFIQDRMIEKSFIYFCKYDYIFIVDVLFRTKNVDMNYCIVFLENMFLIQFHLFFS